MRERQAHGSISDFFFTRLDDADRTFYLEYGRAMAAWAGLERSLALVFARVCAMPDDVADAVFFSSSGFYGRASMLQASIPYARCLPSGTAFLRRLVGLASEYSHTRNSLAHDQHELILEEPMSAIRQISSHRTGATLTAEQTQNAADNFALLARIAELSLGRQRLLKEPDLSLAQIDLMPRDATSWDTDYEAVHRISAELHALQA